MQDQTKGLLVHEPWALQIIELPYLCRTMWPTGCTGSIPDWCTVICPIISNYLFCQHAIEALSVNLLIHCSGTECAANTLKHLYRNKYITVYVDFLLSLASSCITDKDVCFCRGILGSVEADDRSSPVFALESYRNHIEFMIYIPYSSDIQPFLFAYSQI
jgi:hypothetical protein